MRKLLKKILAPIVRELVLKNINDVFKTSNNELGNKCPHKSPGNRMKCEYCE